MIFSAHRQNRPWSGETTGNDESSDTGSSSTLQHDPDCYLCPGNKRVSEIQNPEYEGVHVFTNDRPSISFDAPQNLETPTGLYRNRPATGLTRVMCYSPHHNLTMAEMSPVEVAAVVTEWQRQTQELAGLEGISSVNIFENKGEITGMSNTHPHGQIYATNFIYKTTESHLQAAAEHHQETGRVLFADILDAEAQDGSRIVAQNDTMVAFIPYFARFAYEIYIAPKRTVAHISELTDTEAADFSQLLHNVLIRLDNLWSMPFPYLMMLHQAPVDGPDYNLYHFHLALYPPLRTPELRKYVGAHEIGGGNFLADTMPEVKAAELRACASVRYDNG